MRERRTVRKHFVLTPAEAEKLAESAERAGTSEGAYIRMLIADPTRVFTGPAADALTKIYKGVRKAGVNLNQVAWKLNSGRAGEVHREDVERIADAFDRMLDLLSGTLRGGGRETCRS